MIFKNLGLVDLSPKLDFFLWQTASCTLPKNFALSIGENDLKVFHKYSIKKYKQSGFFYRLDVVTNS